MKKLFGIIIGVLIVAGMVLLLAGNKRKMQEQAQAMAADSTEVVTTYRVVRTPVSRDFTSNGVAQAKSELNFVSEVTGRVVAVMVDKGSRVSKGTPFCALMLIC